MVNFTFDIHRQRGSFGEVSRANVGKRFAIVLDNQILSDAGDPRGDHHAGEGQISGHFDANECDTS